MSRCYLIWSRAVLEAIWSEYPLEIFTEEELAWFRHALS